MALQDLLRWLTRLAYHKQQMKHGERTVNYKQKRKNRRLRKEARLLHQRLRKMGRRRDGTWQ